MLPMSRQPNIVLCICDQLRPFEVGCYGNPVIRTPNLDALAADGTRFEHAVSNNPVCMPARSILLSGQYSRTCTGSLVNRVELDAQGKPYMPERPLPQRNAFRNATLMEELRARDYRTALIGKWHIDAAPELLGFDHALYPFVYHRHTGQTFIETGRPDRVVEGFSVEFEADRVARYLREQDGKKPFFLYYSISPPHMPLMDAPEKYLKMYAPADVPLRENVRVNGRLPYDENWFKIYMWDFLHYKENLAPKALPEGFDLRAMTALYYGMTTWVDDMVGRLMAELEATGLARDTIVVFLSDHGDILGSHHQFNKGRLIEESIRIPMIFRGPGAAPARVNHAQVASIVDVMPTLLEMAGAQVPAHAQGSSLAPVLAGAQEQLACADAFIETQKGTVGLRTPTHLYGVQLDKARRRIEDDRFCFYDLRADPYEYSDLARTGEQAELAADLRARLRDWNERTRWMGADGGEQR